MFCCFFRVGSLFVLTSEFHLLYNQPTPTTTLSKQTITNQFKDQIKRFSVLSRAFQATHSWRYFRSSGLKVKIKLRLLQLTVEFIHESWYSASRRHFCNCNYKDNLNQRSKQSYLILQNFIMLYF